MSKKTKIILLSIIAVLIVVVLSVGITTAFMKPIKQGGNITEVSLSSCAKIKLEGSNSITLSNSYPMSRNKGLQTTPYTFTVTSYCDTYVGFNLYLATLSTNTLPASNIHYIITEKDSKEALAEGTLESTLDAVSEFSDAEKTELNTGLGGAYGNIYKIYNNSVPYKGSTTYDLYLFVDENVTEYQGTTFAAGVAIKSYEREKNMAWINEACDNGQNLSDCIKSTYSYDTTLYYHDNNLANGAGDNSYRYSGRNPNNYVCFGTNTTPCPTDNLYRIIGVFEDKVKLIKYDYASAIALGNNGDYATTYGESGWSTTYYRGNTDLANIGMYRWNYSQGWSSLNDWSSGNLSKINLNTNFLTYLGDSWTDKIANTSWKVGGNEWEKINIIGINNIYKNEILNPSVSTTYDAKIGLMYISEYGYASSPEYWTTNITDNDRTRSKFNWMYMGLSEWTLTRIGEESNVARLRLEGYIMNDLYAWDQNAIRPTFYLESSVNYVSGSGSVNNPIVIN